jgi:fatty acid desaturase
VSLISQGDAPLAVSPLSPGPAVADAPAAPLHAAARRQMASGIEAQLAALRRLDTRKRVGELGLFVALFAGGAMLNSWGLGAGSGAWSHSLPRIAGTLCAAVAINAFILFMHEGMHGTLFGGGLANRWVSVALGTTFCLSFTSYRVMHQRHHRYLGDPRDPDDYANYIRNRPLLWAMHYMRLIIGVYVYIVMIPILAYRHSGLVDRRRILVEYVALAAVYAALFSAVPTGLLLYLWLIPLVLAAHMTAIRGLTQHGIAEAADPFLASRSIQANAVVAFCLLHENYHLEHHLFPEIPSYHLAEVHRLIWPRLPRAVTGRSYLGFLWRFFAATLRMDDTPIGRANLDGGKDRAESRIELIGWEV